MNRSGSTAGDLALADGRSPTEKGSVVLAASPLWRSERDDGRASPERSRLVPLLADGDLAEPDIFPLAARPGLTYNGRHDEDGPASPRATVPTCMYVGRRPARKLTAATPSPRIASTHREPGGHRERPEGVLTSLVWPDAVYRATGRTPCVYSARSAAEGTRLFDSSWPGEKKPITAVPCQRARPCRWLQVAGGCMRRIWSGLGLHIPEIDI